MKSRTKDLHFVQVSNKTAEICIVTGNAGAVLQGTPKRRTSGIPLEVALLCAAQPIFKPPESKSKQWHPEKHFRYPFGRKCLAGG